MLTIGAENDRIDVSATCGRKRDQPSGVGFPYSQPGIRTDGGNQFPVVTPGCVPHLTVMLQRTSQSFAGSGIPYGGKVVLAGSDDPLSIGTECGRKNRPGMTHRLRHSFACGPIPDLRTTITH